MFCLKALALFLVIEAVKTVSNQQKEYKVIKDYVDIICIRSSTLYPSHPAWYKCSSWTDDATCRTLLVNSLRPGDVALGYETKVQYIAPLTMRLKNLVLEDSTKYRCSGTYIQQSDVSVYVTETPTIQGIIDNKLTVRSTYEESVTCNVRYNANDDDSRAIKWKVGSTLLSGDLGIPSGMITATNTLTHRFSKGDHSKFLKCMLTTDGRTTWAYTSVQLNVQYPPENVESTCTTDTFLLAGESYPCTCSAINANPEATVEWLGVNGTSEKNTVVTDFSVSASGNGQTWSCSATHPLLTPNSIIVPFTMNVTFGPTDVTIRHTTGQAGYELTVVCDTTSVNPAATMTFSGLSNGVSTTTRIGDGDNNGHIYRASYTFIPQRADNGKAVTCTAANSHRQTPSLTATKTATLNIEYPPETINVSKSCKNRQWYISGNNYSCRCSVGDANPAAATSWRIGNAKWTSTNPANFTVSKAHNGQQFTCRAEHSLLADRSVRDGFYMNVAFLLEAIADEPCDREVITELDDYAQLCLHIDANPQPIKFEWKKGTTPNFQDINSNIVARNDSFSASLTFVNVTADDFGEYTLIVSNGIGEAKLFVFELIVFHQDNLDELVVEIVVPVACLLVIAGICSILIWCVRKARMKRSNETYLHHTRNFSQPLHEYVTCKPNTAKESVMFDNFKPKWAIDRSSVTLLHKVREGRFGYWFKGKAVVNSGHNRVTVTIIMTNKDDGDNTDLLNQFNLWKLLDGHPNLVSLLGCCIEKEPVYIVAECISNGNLHAYLRKSGSDHEYGNMLAGSNALTPRDLMVFGVQVAAGMEYLSSLQIVHGDLATRNVLLDENHTCKICDFGPNSLSSQQATRWMSPENLLDNTFTSNSDVWSYGVLLWEIATLAATPYPGMSCQQVKDFVQDGGKLSKPRQCDIKLYDIMLCCWVSTPELRHGFPTLRNALLDMLDNATDYIVIEK